MSARDDRASDDLVAPGTPIDLDNCAREPIHIPGSIQPRGVLIVLREPDEVVVQVSANIGEALGVPAGRALGAPLASVVGASAAAQIERAATVFGDLRDRNPLEVAVPVAGRMESFDAILHRADGGLLLLELEVASGPRPFSFPNTYLAVRGAVAELNRESELAALYDITARAVAELTGFDRVMVYRYDADYNGEVVAEAKRAHLNSFLGLHYPASDIPAQARALYEKNWLRLIDDVDYVPVPLVAAGGSAPDRPLDMTYSTLRSVSPIHVEYLRNMGVRASMSISLLRDGRLWGLIACHHYAGPHLPPYGTRAAAEFLGSAMSLRLVDRAADDELRDKLTVQAVLTRLTAAMSDQHGALSAALLGPPGLLDLVRADGALVVTQERVEARGATPSLDVAGEIAEWARTSGEGVTATVSLAQTLPDLAVAPEQCSGALAMTLPHGQYAMWFRREARQAVDWGGDPRNKAIAVAEGAEVRISPRKSFERWREVVRERCEPWTAADIDAANGLRRNVIEAMYQHSRAELRLAENLQRSLLPELPHLRGWTLSAHYEPAEGGNIGGDWYDAFQLRDGRLAVVLGDVAGHGISAAGTMAQLRNALRSYLLDAPTPQDAVTRLNDFMLDLLPSAFATALVACVDLADGRVTATRAGHLNPLLLSPGGAPVAVPVEVPVATSPPLGVAGAAYVASEFELAENEGLLLFSDGLIERRDEELGIGVQRLAALVGRLGTADARTIGEAVGPGGVSDDATVLTILRGVASAR
ncbi:SpoIIE family protein phosphatase [uncultured Jatrophihabitans sp.]|uniref:SpoIIE family protein phosphatase n=1 Tax=uncultured Jatrophihabitans sp. TaxID=1610747 RepID=UPI0035CC76F5